MTLILSGTDGLSDVDGSAATPAIRGTDANTGIFFPAADTIAFSEGGTEAMRIDSSGNVGIGRTPSAWVTGGGSALQGYSFGIASTNTGGFDTTSFVTNAYSSSASAWAYVGTAPATRYDQFSGSHIWYGAASGTAGNAVTFSERMRIDTSGNLLVGTTSTTGRIGSKAATTDNTGYGIYVEDSAAALMFYARNDGVISTGAKTASPYNNTTASAANMFVSSAGILQRSTSSLKYKTNVQDAAHGLAELLTLRSVTYEGKTDGSKVFGGLIAEEIHEAGLTEFVQYAEDGSPDALAYGNMVSLCIKAIQEQQAIITTLTDRITALETPTGTQA